MQEPDDLYKTLGLTPPPDQSLRKIRRDGSPVHIPSPEEIEILQRSKSPHNPNKRIAWTVLGLFVLLLLFVLFIRTDDHNRDGWPGIRMVPRSGMRPATFVPDP